TASPGRSASGPRRDEDGREGGSSAGRRSRRLGDKSLCLLLVDRDPPDRQGAAGLGIDLDQGAMEAGVAGGDLEIMRDEGQGRGEDAGVPAAEDGVARA